MRPGTSTDRPRGMGTRRTTEDRADRRAADKETLGRYTRRTPPSESSPGRSERQPALRHCWIKGPDEKAVEGLMIRWIADRGGWLAEVVIIDDGQLRVVTVSAAHVRPARK